MPGNRLTLHCCLEGSTPEDGSGASHQAKDIVVAPGGAYFLLPTAAILFSGGLEGPARQDWELRHRVLPRLVLSRAYDGRPKAECLLSLQKLFDLFPLQANPSNPW